LGAVPTKVVVQKQGPKVIANPRGGKELFQKPSGEDDIIEETPTKKVIIKNVQHSNPLNR